MINLNASVRQRWRKLLAQPLHLPSYRTEEAQLLSNPDTERKGEMDPVGMNQDGAFELFQYWDKLRGKRPAPQRAEIEPTDIKALLPSTFILERDARGEAVFRLAGTGLCAIYGRELKGHSFSSLWAERDQHLIARLARHALDELSVTVVAFEGLSREGRINSFELVILPLEGERGAARALGLVQPLMKPYWLEADPIEENRIDSFRIVQPDNEEAFPANRSAMSVPPLSPDGTTLSRPLHDGGRRIRHLIVFEGGRQA